jgi:hypothetical protein
MELVDILGCYDWVLALIEEHNLMVSENKVHNERALLFVFFT